MNIKQAIYLMRLHKPIGIFLLLWPTWWALWLASAGKPDSTILIVFTLGVVLARSAGCIINDFADRHIDKYVERTRQRPLTNGKVTVQQALTLFSILMLCAFVLVLLFLNRLTIFLSFAAAVFMIFYPFLKRITHLPQLGLGVAFAWGVPMAFAAVNQTIHHAAWIVFFSALIWPVMYDTMYAMVDRLDDLKIGVKSTAILFGNHDKAMIAVLQCIFISMLLKIGYSFALHASYFIAIIIVGLLFCYQQWLIRDRDPNQCFKAFLNNNWVGLTIFVGILFS